MATYHFKIKNDTKPNGQKVSAKGHVDYILREDAKSHATYIAREGKTAQKSDCVFKAVQLPRWANRSAQKFFEAATRYEDKGNRRFKEIEFSLPNELTLEQNREIIDRFIAAHLSNHYYAYAIHDKTGVLSNQRHPHVHIMFSERLIDDVEIAKERPAYRYFRRAAKPLKGDATASFEHRSEHGAPKDKRWHDRNFLIQIREDFARIQNEVLKKYGYAVRVDHRSLKNQQLEAEKRGDHFLAQVLDRVPEKYIGITAAHDFDGLSEELKRNRKVQLQKFDTSFKIDLREKILAETQAKEMVRRAEVSAIALLQSESSDLNSALKQKIHLELTTIKSLKRKLVRVHEAEEKFQAEYLSKSERHLLCEYENAVAQKFNLEKLLTELVAPNKKHVEQVRAFQAIESAIRAKIQALGKSTEELSLEIKRLEEKLQDPYLRHNIQLATHFRLQENLETLKEMHQVGESLLRDVQEFEKLMPTPEIPKTIFSLADVQEILRQNYHSLKKAYEKSLEERNKLRWKIISPARALFIARNIFVHGAFKTLRVEQQKHEKAAKTFERQFSKFKQRLSDFKNTTWTDPREKFLEQYYLRKEKLTLDVERQKLADSKIALDAKETHLEKICSSVQAQQQIALIAAGVLRKNLTVVKEYENAKTRSGDLFQKLQLMKKRLEILKSPCPRILKTALYRIIPAEFASSKNSFTDQNSIAAIIADALGGEKYAVPLVAYSSGNALEMDKTWDLLSDLDKDEILQRNIVRDL